MIQLIKIWFLWIKSVIFKQRMLSKGPNNLNLNAYANKQQQPYSDGEQIDQHQNMDTKDIEDQFDNFINDMKSYDEVLGKVAKSIQEVGQSQQFITEFYPLAITNYNYDNEYESQMIQSVDPELQNVMSKLYHANKVIKEELKGWLFQYAKKSRLTEVLISQNQLLRNYIGKKNKDIVNLIQSLSNTENTEIISLSQDLKQLKQQNGMLLNHLKQIKEEIKSKKLEEQNVKLAYEKAQKQKLQIQKLNKQAEEEEQHYSKLVTLLESSIDEIQKRKKRLEIEKDKLKKQKLQYSKDQKMLEGQIQQCQKDKQQIENTLKNKHKNHEGEKYRIMSEIQQKTEAVIKQKALTNFYDAEINRNQNKKQEYQKLIKDLDKKLQEKEETLKKNQEQLKGIIQKQTQQASQIDILKYQIEVLQDQFEEVKQKDKIIDDKYKRQIKDLEQQHKAQLVKANRHLNQVHRQTAMKILQEKSVLAVSQKQIEQWERKTMEKKQQIKELKDQMKQIRENQLLAAQLRQKLKNMQKS